MSKPESNDVTLPRRDFAKLAMGGAAMLSAAGTSSAKMTPIPPGIKIGDIVQIISGSATTPHQIFIQPAAKLGSMQEVGVLLYEPPPRIPFEQKLTSPTKDKK
jgi:hypothetical protein